MINEDKNFEKEYNWYFRAEADQFNTKISVALWSPYDISINSIIEKAYLNYLKSEGKISHKVEINGYEINFLKNMQFNLKEKFRQRPVLRSHKCPENIIRINKFDQNFLSKNTDIVQIDNEKIQLINEDYFIELINIFPGKEITKIDLPSDLRYTNFDIKNFDDLKNKIKEGLKAEAILLNEEDSYNEYLRKYFKNLGNVDAFQTFIIKTYTQEGFIYRRLNKIMRDNLFTDKTFENMKYYYLALMYSLQELVKTVPNRSFTLYRGFQIDKSQIEYYNSLKPKTLIYFHQFLSTSERRSVAKNFFIECTDDKMNCMMTIDIPSNSETKLSFIKELSCFDSEEEVLLKSGTILQFESIKIDLKKNVVLRFSLVPNNMEALSIFIKNSNLATIDLSYNNIGDIGAKFISESLKNHSTLSTLYLRWNSLGEIGIKFISESLVFNSKITSLDLSSNSIGELGAMYMSQLLIKNNSLIELDLSSNSIGEVGTKYISESLIKNKSLTKLDLSDNNIGKEGARYISESLLNTFLKDINLISNCIGEMGAKYINDSLTKNRNCKVKF